MPVQLQGFSGTVDEVEANTRARRVVCYPLDVGSLGAYSLAMSSGVMAAGLAAAAPVFHFRWTHATNLCILRSIQISAGGITAFTAGFVTVDAIFARSWTVAGTGGTAATITGNNNKKRTSFATTSLGEARCSSTAALTQGTATLDSQAFAAITQSTTATAGTLLVPPFKLWTRDTSDEYPVVFAQNEGFTVRATVPATGTWTFSVQVEWAELASF